MSDMYTVAPEVASLDFATLPKLSEPPVMDLTRPHVDHKNFPRPVYTYIRGLLMAYWTIRYMGKHYSYPTAVALILYLVGIPYWVIIPVTLGVYYYYAKQVNAMLEGICKLAIGHEFEKPVIKTLPEYKDNVLIWRLWATSPTRAVLLRLAAKSGLVGIKEVEHALNIAEQEKKTTPIRQGSSDTSPSVPIAPWDRPEEAVVYQPVEGFCGPATINSALRSIPGAKQVPFAAMPGPITMANYGCVLLEDPAFVEAASGTIKSITSCYCDNEAFDFEKFKSIVKLANDPKYRILVNFLRAPLFFERPEKTRDLAWRLMAGHWSTLCSADTDSGLCLINDVNDSYGPFVLDVRRLYEACYTRDGCLFRGIILFELNSAETSD